MSKVKPLKAFSQAVGETLSKGSKRTWRDLRKSGEVGRPEAQQKAAETLSSISKGMAGQNLIEYLSSVLLEVCPENSYEALLEDRGRKAMAQDLLNMLLMDGPKDEEQK